MPIKQVLVNLDDYYSTTSGRKILLNDIEYHSKEDRELVIKSLSTAYDGDTISSIPSCDCGTMSGGYLKGKTCTHCGSVVKLATDETDPILWARILEGQQKFLNPHFWLMLSDLMHSSIDYVRWLSDPSYNPNKPLPSFIQSIVNTFVDFERSYTYMVNNMWDILVHLNNHSVFKKPKKNAKIRALMELYKRDIKLIYSNHLPILNKNLFIVESTSLGKFTSLGMANVTDLTLQFIKSNCDANLSDVKKGAVQARFISNIALLSHQYFKDYLSGKLAIFRKQVYGGRAHFTFRAVIVSITGPHNYDNVHLPWSIGVVIFRPHLLNLLVKMGYVYKVASQMLFDAVNEYNQVISDLMDKLLNDAKYKGKIGVIAQRNPSLHRGSAIRLNITKIKKNVSDKTVGISILIVKSMNADFDGDEVNFILLNSNDMYDMAASLDPALSVPGRSSLYNISKLLSLPSPTIATMANYLSTPPKPPVNNSFNESLVYE